MNGLHVYTLLTINDTPPHNISLLFCITILNCYCLTPHILLTSLSSCIESSLREENEVLFISLLTPVHLTECLAHIYGLINMLVFIPSSSLK